MTIGSPFDSRAQALNVKRQWREWSGFFASSAYAAHHDIEVNAIRNAAALIDVSPLFKYRCRGPDAQRLVDRVITRDATKLARGQVYYTPWCDEHGKVIDDGTVSRLDDDSYRWTAADAQLRWLRLNARGLDVAIEETSEQVAALALQGPLVTGRAGGGDRRAVRGPALLPAPGESHRRHRHRRQPHRLHRRPGLRAVGRRGAGRGRCGMRSWQRVAAYALRPAGMLALDVVRVEAGLILLEVDYTSSMHALIPEQSYSPGEIGLGRLVAWTRRRSFVGQSRAPQRSALPAGRPGGWSGWSSTGPTSSACMRRRT